MLMDGDFILFIEEKEKWPRSKHVFFGILVMMNELMYNFRLDKFSKETTVVNQIFGGFLRSQGMYMCLYYYIIEGYHNLLI